MRVYEDEKAYLEHPEINPEFDPECQEWFKIIEEKTIGELLASIKEKVNVTRKHLEVANVRI